MRGVTTFVLDYHKEGEKNMTCKGICIRHKAQKPVGSGRYASGQKRCQICEIFIKWEGLWCPCCGYRLRTKPRNLKYKAKLRARTRMQTIRLLDGSGRPLLEVMPKSKSRRFNHLARQSPAKLNRG
jgi:hypothetical protein